MKNISKKAVLSILSLVLTFVALGATTFAWFSLGTTAVVNPFEVQVKGSEGLEITLEGDSNWYAVLNSDLIYDYIIDKFNEGLDPNDQMSASDKFVMDALTSKDGVDLYKYGIKENSEEGFELDHTTKADKFKDFISLELKLRTTSIDKAINLKDLIVTDQDLTSNNFERSVAVPFTLAKGTEPKTANDTITAHLSDALRISFVIAPAATEGTVFEKAEDTTNTLGSLAQNDGNYIGSFEYFAKRLGYTVTAGENRLIPMPSWTPANTETNGFGAELNHNLFAAGTGAVSGDYQVYSLSVNIWFEGYDNEAFDAVLDQLVSISMAFELV